MIRKINTRPDISPLDILQKCRGVPTKSFKTILINGQPRLVTVECYPSSAKSSQGSIFAVALTQRQTDDLNAVAKDQDFIRSEKTNVENVYYNKDDNPPAKLASMQDMADVDRVEMHDVPANNYYCDENNTSYMLQSVNGDVELKSRNVRPHVFEENAISDLSQVTAVESGVNRVSKVGGDIQCARSSETARNQSYYVDYREVPPQIGSVLDQQPPNVANVGDTRRNMNENDSKITCEIISPKGCQDFSSNNQSGKISVKNLPQVNRLTDKFRVPPKFQLREGGKPRPKKKKQCCGYMSCSAAYRQTMSEWSRLYKPIVSVRSDTPLTSRSGSDYNVTPSSSKTSISSMNPSAPTNCIHLKIRNCPSKDQMLNKSSNITFMKTHPVIKLKSSSGGRKESDVGSSFPPEQIPSPGATISTDYCESMFGTSLDDEFNLQGKSTTELENSMFEQYFLDSNLENRTSKLSGLFTNRNYSMQDGVAHSENTINNKITLTNSLPTNYTSYGTECDGMYWPEQDVVPPSSVDTEKYDVVNSGKHAQNPYSIFDHRMSPAHEIFEIIDNTIDH